MEGNDSEGICKRGTCHLFIALPSEGILLAQTHWPLVGLREPQGPTALIGTIISGNIRNRLRTSHLLLEQLGICLQKGRRTCPGPRRPQCTATAGTHQSGGIASRQTVAVHTGHFATVGHSWTKGREESRKSVLREGVGERHKENGLKREFLGKGGMCCKKRHMAHIGS